MTNEDKNEKIVLVHGRPPEQARGLSSLPLGILYLGTVLKEEGYSNILLIDHSFVPFENLVSAIIDFRPNFVGLNAMSAYFQSVKKVGKYLKDNLPAVKIIVGGPHASIRKTETLINEIRPDLLSFSITTPFKGTGLYQMCRERGLFDLNSYDQLDFRGFKSRSLPIRNRTLTYQDIEGWKNNLLKKRRLKFLLRYSWKTFINFLKRPSLKFLIRTYQDFRALRYIG